MAELLTHSKRRDFQNCPRYFYLRHELHLSLRAQKSGRRRGTIFGDALQAARDQHQREGASDLFGPLVAAISAVDAGYDEAMFHVGSADEATTLEVERRKVRVMVEHYLKRYGLAARREVEFYQSYRHPLTGGYSKTFRLAGKIDGLEVVGPQRARVVEDKFVGQIQKAMIDRLPLDQQTTEYVLALATNGWSAEVAYRHTRVPGLNPAKAKTFKTKSVAAEGLDEYEARLSEDVAVRPEFYFDEQILYFPQQHLEEYTSERWVIGQLIVYCRHLAKTEGAAAFPKNPSRCWEYGGCEFIPLCTMQEGAADRYVVTLDNPELSNTGASADGATEEYGPGSAQADR